MMYVHSFYALYFTALQSNANSFYYQDDFVDDSKATHASAYTRKPTLKTLEAVKVDDAPTRKAKGKVISPFPPPTLLLPYHLLITYFVEGREGTCIGSNGTG